MKKNRRVEIIKKTLESICYNCGGEGYLMGDLFITKKKKDCPTCKGTGIYKESFYYHICNGICLEGDSLK